MIRRGKYMINWQLPSSCLARNSNCVRWGSALSDLIRIRDKFSSEIHRNSYSSDPKLCWNWEWKVHVEMPALNVDCAQSILQPRDLFQFGLKYYCSMLMLCTKPFVKKAQNWCLNTSKLDWSEEVMLCTYVDNITAKYPVDVSSDLRSKWHRCFEVYSFTCSYGYQRTTRKGFGGIRFWIGQCLEWPTRCGSSWLNPWVWPIIETCIAPIVDPVGMVRNLYRVHST